MLGCTPIFRAITRAGRFLRLGAHMCANPQKFEKGSMGEDALFVCDEPCPAEGTHQAFGVADGVGDWVFLRGVDSALYSRNLMAVAKQFFRDLPDGDPKHALRHCYDKVKEMQTPGSSTICLANFACDTSRLSVANLVRAQ